MPSVNKQIIVGHVGRDPEVRFINPTGGGEPRMVANFSIATTERFKGRDKTEWHRCTAWGKLAEIVEKMVRKGKLIYCEGRTQTSKWTDRAGVERETKEVNLTELRMLSKKDEGEQVSLEMTRDEEERLAAFKQREEERERAAGASTSTTPDADLPF